MKTDGNLTYWMRWMGGGLALAVAYGSAKLSVTGIGLGGDLWWLNWVIALALFIAEFMVNGEHEELNWLMLVMGLGAYLYSIATNIVGIGNYMEAGTAGSTISWLGVVTMYGGGLFMDVFPELTLRWALRESKVGDAIGNLVKTVRNPDMLTKSFTVAQPGFKSEHTTGLGSKRKEELRTQYSRPTREVVKPDMDEDMPMFIRPTPSIRRHDLA